MKEKYRDPSGLSDDARLFRVTHGGGFVDSRLESRAEAMREELGAMCGADISLLSEAIKNFPPDQLGSLEVFARRLLAATAAGKKSEAK